MTNRKDSPYTGILKYNKNYLIHDYLCDNNNNDIKIQMFTKGSLSVFNLQPLSEAANLNIVKTYLKDGFTYENGKFSSIYAGKDDFDSSDSSDESEEVLLMSEGEESPCTIDNNDLRDNNDNGTINSGLNSQNSHIPVANVSKGEKPVNFSEKLNNIGSKDNKIIKNHVSSDKKGFLSGSGAPPGIDIDISVSSDEISVDSDLESVVNSDNKISNDIDINRKQLVSRDSSDADTIVSNADAVEVADNAVNSNDVGNKDYFKRGPKKTVTRKWYHDNRGHLKGHSLEADAAAQGFMFDPGGGKWHESKDCMVCGKFNARKRKITRHRTVIERIPGKLKNIQWDISGPYLRSFHGNRYTTISVCVNTKYSLIDFMQNRNKESIKFNIKSLIQNTKQYGNIIRIQTDGEKGMQSRCIKRLLLRRNINHEIIPADTPKLNGLVENKIFEAQKGCKILLHQANLDTASLIGLWEDAKRYYVETYLNTRFTQANDSVSPEFKVTGKATIPGSIPIFGSLADVMVSDDKKIKKNFSPDSARLIFVGFCPKGYPNNRVGLFYNEETSKYWRSINYTIYNEKFRERLDDESDKYNYEIDDDGSEWESESEHDSDSVDSLDSDYSSDNVEEEIFKINKWKNKKNHGIINTSDIKEDDYMYVGGIDHIHTLDTIPASFIYRCPAKIDKGNINKIFNLPTSGVAVTAGEVFQSENLFAAGDANQINKTNSTIIGETGVFNSGDNDSDGIYTFVDAYSKYGSMEEHHFDGLGPDIYAEEEVYMSYEYYGKGYGGKITNEVIDIDPHILIRDIEEFKVSEVHVADIKNMAGKLINRGKCFMNRREVESLKYVIDSAVLHNSDVIPEIFSAFNISALKGENIPQSVKEALKSVHSPKWKDAIQTEYDQLMKNHTWDVVEAPIGRKIVDSRWVFAKKLNPDGSVRRFKARFVAKGFSQVHGLDYTDTYAPVIGMISLRMVLSLATSKGWDIHQLDVETAFLNSTVDEEIYVRQPEGYHIGGSNMVLKLNKSLYGLKQAPANWNKMLKEFMVSSGLKQSKFDECLYTYRDKDGKLCVVTVYVDDIIITGDAVDYIQWLKKEMNVKFTMKDMTDNHQLLGLTFYYDKAKGTLKLSQRLFIEKIIDTHCIRHDSEQYTTPALPNTYKLFEEFLESKKEPIKSSFPYREAVGMLMYLAVMTRPDISNIVRYLSKFVNNFHSLHVSLLQRVLCYLRGTKDIGIVFRKGDNKLKAYSDSSYSDDYFTGRSTTGSLIMLNGGPLMWKSVMQLFVVMSSTHAEYAAISETINAVEYAKSIYDEILGSVSEGVVVQNSSPDRGSTALSDFKEVCVLGVPVQVFVDNQAAIYIGMHDTSGKRAKHINVRFNNVREKVLSGSVVLEYINTKDQLADIFTKCLGKNEFVKLRDLILG